MDPKRLINALSHRIDALYWERVDGDPEILHQRTSQHFRDVPLPKGDPLFVDMIKARSADINHEYIDRVRGHLHLDPRSGSVILRGGQLLARSLPYTEMAGRPSLATWVMARSGVAPVLKLDRCISFRDVFETNYFHFFNDLITKIPLLEEKGMLGPPIIVGRELHRMPYIQEILPKLVKAGLEIIDQGHRTIQCNEIIYCKAMPFERRYHDRIMDLLDVGPPETARTGRRVFLTRGGASRNKRVLSNSAEVQALLHDQGFEMIDSGSLTLQAQIELMRDTGILIGLHGAGLTNIIFRRGAPLTILEIFPADYVPPHYHWLAYMYGYEHHTMVVPPSSPKGDLELPLDRLKGAIDELTRNSEGPGPGSPASKW